MSINITDKQWKAINLAKDWWNNESNIRPFSLTGLAGSGKTTVIHYIIEEFGLSSCNVAFVTFTGTAANVLTKKGNPATTIHKLIYDPIVDEDTHEVHFKLKESLDERIKLIVIDEVSMVNDNLLNDIKSFNIPILTCGDPEQLPPVKSSINSLILHPDFFLDEPLRQSLKNPIIYLANLARKGERIRYGNYGDNVKVIRKDEITMSMYSDVDQIIACKNKTVSSLNIFYRKIIKGIKSKMPVEDDKLICLKNNWDRRISSDFIDVFLTNGLIGYCKDIKDFNEKFRTFKMDFIPKDFSSEKFTSVLSDSVYFEDNIKDDKEMYDNNEKYGELLYLRKLYSKEFLIKINKFTYGYCITCHKSQGQEYDSVLFIDEFYNKEIYPKSLYTGITRAKEKLIIAK